MRNTSAKSVTPRAAFLILLLSLLIPSISSAQNNGDSSGFGLLRKQQAISKLGNRLAAVAAKHGKSPSELRRLFLQDSTLHIDKNERLLYVDRAPDEMELAAAAQEAPSAPQAAPHPLSQTFTLHSRPGSSRTIYLDFDGHSVDTSNQWFSYLNGTGGVAQPFDIDANPAFNTIELEAIQAIWQRISEDFAPFDVNVTTEYPGEDALLRDGYSDQRYGTRAVMTTTNFMGAGIGGVAYIGTFDFPGSEIYQPAWIFTAGFGSAKSIAEAASHEIGHNLGLVHDGTSTQGYYGGQGVWAPIMGVGYSKSVSQWSKGEYYDANNQEDDLAIIQSHGAPLIADEYGDTPAAARVLSGTGINVSGLITTRTDVDVFRFTTGAGNVSININSAPVGGNLDIKAQILDSAGNVIATSDPSSIALSASFPAGISASFNQFLSAGTYYLTVDGVGIAETDTRTGYSDYASIGQYSITGTLGGSGGGSGGGTQQAPVAIVSANPLSGTAPLTVNFSSAGSNDPDGSIVSYAWNFGDGTASAAQNPSKIYNSAGTFTATLTVTDNSGLTGSNSVVINVTNLVPVASIAGTISYGITPAGQSAKSVPGVFVMAYGSTYSTTTTGTNGSYLLGNLIINGGYVVTPSKAGNVNGITTFDATLVMRHIAAGGVGANALNFNQQLAADVNNDGFITAFDASQILRYVAANQATEGTGEIGNWRFSPVPRNYDAVSSALTNQNYEAILVGEINGDWSATAPAKEIALTGKRDNNDQSEAASQQPEAQIQISLPQNASGQNGSTVLIPITLISDNTPIGAYTIEVTFDSTVLQPNVEPISTTGAFGGCSIASSRSNTGNRSTLRIAAACPSNIRNSGTLFNMRFNVVGTANTATGMTTLEFTVRTGNSPVPFFQSDVGTTIPVVATNGNFTVSSNIPNASVTVAGRVLTANGQGLRNAQVLLTNADSSSKTVMSGTLGHYRFANVQVGQQITIQVFSKRFGFQPYTVNVSGDVSDLNFVAQP